MNLIFSGTWLNHLREVEWHPAAVFMETSLRLFQLVLGVRAILTITLGCCLVLYVFLYSITCGHLDWQCKSNDRWNWWCHSRHYGRGLIYSAMYCQQKKYPVLVKNALEWTWWAPWLRPWARSAGGPSLISGQGTSPTCHKWKIPHATTEICQSQINHIKDRMPLKE